MKIKLWKSVLFALAAGLLLAACGEKSTEHPGENDALAAAAHGKGVYVLPDDLSVALKEEDGAPSTLSFHVALTINPDSSDYGKYEADLSNWDASGKYDEAIKNTAIEELVTYSASDLQADGGPCREAIRADLNSFFDSEDLISEVTFPTMTYA